MTERVSADVVVVGGGMTGVAAALSAARLGSEVALVNDRPVLGGNASSEVRVWVNGATGGANNRYAREGGVMEELLQRKKYEGLRAGADVWDAVLIDAVRAQDGLSLFLNTLVTDVETDGDRVTAAVGHQHMSERSFRFEAPLFVDATGDAVLAAQAGAEWVMGREAAAAFGERAAPETGDDRTLGSSIMFSTREKDEPVDYEPPGFARDFREDPPEIVATRTDPAQRNECYWWIEYGGDGALDSIADNEAIRDELWAVVYGVWDYVKNSGAFPEEEVARLDLEWVGKVPGKRESRRVRGDYVVTESDIVDQRRFDDAVGHGGWSIDLHPPSGIYDDQGRGSEHWHADGPYSYPYRSLYARDLANVFVPGRHMSASHVAFGSLRVQMTLATAGQAAGTAAALCRRRSCTPAELAADGVDALQQALLREDQWIPGERNADPTDHARDAAVSASSEQPAELTDPTTTVDLGDVEGSDLGVHLACEGRVDAVELLLSAPDEPVDLAVAVHDESRPENTIPDERLRVETVTVPESPSWVDVPVGVDVGDGQGLFLVLRDPAGVRVHGRERELTGAMALPRRENPHDDYEGLPERGDRWGVEGTHATGPTDWVPCFRFRPAQAGYEAANVTDGHARPFGLAHSWLSTPFDEAGERSVAADSEWIELAWDEPRTLCAVQCAWNTRLTDWFNVYGHGHTGARAEPETVRDYRLEYRDGDAWETLSAVRDNYRRFRRHTFDPVETDRLRLVVEATNGVPWVELFELRAYGPDHDLPLEAH